MKCIIPCLILAVLPAILLAEPTIAITDFDDGYDTDLSRIVPNILAENIINSGRFDLYERERLDAILREQNLQTSGVIDPATAVELGKLSGIDFLLTGEIVDFGREVRSFSGYGVQTETEFYRLEAAVRIIDARTGKVVFSKTESVEERQNQGAGTRVADTTIDTRLGRKAANLLTDAILNADVFRTESREAPPAVIHISSEPANASIEVDGIFYGNAGTGLELPAGVHLIKVSLPGYEIWEKKVMVRDGARIHVPLVRKADIRIEVEQ